MISLGFIHGISMTILFAWRLWVFKDYNIISESYESHTIWLLYQYIVISLFKDCGDFVIKPWSKIEINNANFLGYYKLSTMAKGSNFFCMGFLCCSCLFVYVFLFCNNVRAKIVLNYIVVAHYIMLPEREKERKGGRERESTTRNATWLTRTRWGRHRDSRADTP